MLKINYRHKTCFWAKVFSFFKNGQKKCPKMKIRKNFPIKKHQKFIHGSLSCLANLYYLVKEFKDLSPKKKKVFK
jgi:hypothetical protein